MLKELLVSRVRVAILALFLTNPEQPFHIREIARQVGTEINAVRRELKRLTKIGLLKREPRGNRVYLRIRKDFPLYDELLSILFKERGFGRKILENKETLGRIRFASVAKSFLKGAPANPEKVDLLFVGNLSLPLLKNLIREEEGKREREINYTVLTEEEFAYRKRIKDRFLADILSQPYLMLLGSEEKFS